MAYIYGINDRQIFVIRGDQLTEVGCPGRIAVGLHRGHRSAEPRSHPARLQLVHWVTFDGEASSQQPTGQTEGRNNKRVNMFSAEISTVDSSIVWAEGYDQDRSGNAARRIYRSADGGRTFTGMLDGLEVTLMNGTDLYPARLTKTSCTSSTAPDTAVAERICIATPPR